MKFDGSRYGMMKQKLQPRKNNTEQKGTMSPRLCRKKFLFFFLQILPNGAETLTSIFQSVTIFTKEMASPFGCDVTWYGSTHAAEVLDALFVIRLFFLKKRPCSKIASMCCCIYSLCGNLSDVFLLNSSVGFHLSQIETNTLLCE